MNKIIRTICFFEKNPTTETIKKLDSLSDLLIEKGFEIQTRRVCSPNIVKIKELDSRFAGDSYIFGLGSLKNEDINNILTGLYNTKDTSFNIDLTDVQITLSCTEILFKLVKEKPAKTFNFTYCFNNSLSSPFFPSSAYDRDGFSIGLQPTDLSEECRTLEEWLKKVKDIWLEIYDLFESNREFLGIDSSIAPLFLGKSSLINFIKRLEIDFNQSATTDIYIKITNFLKKENPKPIGLCGIMFPCLEDFELADEYEKGNFNIERNVYLSLHSGLGIDTYPIGIDENPKQVLKILKLVQGLSNKYKKPLSVRFVSDGKTKIGQKTDFRNQYLKDITVRSL